jgi:hypothetical protein
MKQQRYLQTLALIIILVYSFPVFSQDDYFNPDYQRNTNYIYTDNIKSVLLYKEGFEMAAPLVTLNSNDKLIFSFDDLNGDYVRYEYTVVHCDADWNESDLMFNEYLDTFQSDYVEDFQFAVNTMQDYTYYHGYLPNDVIRWRLSGNYILKVYVSGDPEDVLFTRRFYVMDPKVSVMAKVNVPSKVADRKLKQEVVFSINMQPFPVSDPYREVLVTVMQNGRLDNAITDLQPREVRGNELIYNYDDINVFDGGSDFRYFDMKSLRYNSMRVKSIEYAPQTGYQVYLHDDNVKKKNVYESIQESMNGRFLIKTEDMTYTDFEADYAMVHFFLPYATPLIQGKLYLFGELTEWQYLPENELVYDYEAGGFRASIFLKQGFYNYQYMLLPNDSKIGDVTFIEGNFFDTNNEYTFFVYYRPLGGRYDQLINVMSMLSHPN